MWYNQFRPALRRPAQPEFALYHIFQKKSNKIFLSNCTIFFPEISFFCATCTIRLCGRVPNSTPICDPFCLAARARAHMPAAPEGSWPLKNFFYQSGDRRVALIFPYGRDIARNLACCPQKFFRSLSPGKIGPIAKIERVQ